MRRQNGLQYIQLGIQAGWELHMAAYAAKSREVMYGLRRLLFNPPEYIRFSSCDFHSSIAHTGTCVSADLTHVLVQALLSIFLGWVGQKFAE
ncbi:hypothetical protein J3A64_002518 [Pseudarthrobacter sp. PvP004]|nr:hypothetical protein [Pseudarthrobacter sp. PvP004]